ncbi:MULTISPECIES: DUF3035 domain-containing protein [Phaeobacter]|uniref:Beta-barrel assembly machine subunit BamF n=2 Tax=Phaeobacter TaxID=302485 RepID=A0A135IEY3_9RHOB|nr:MULTISPECIES: DUF3035 domain-containing protein [Phaeobacter]ATG44985.1 Beta-barrel assembly machine subunit BamF [Phaeobacter piscinae]AUQ51570.1 Beta-barrel assembly machine subunit BamF [Phaeobacter inhibens]AUQ72062.1 Beta-barrel assembly machine subunit BamF [Phaeobacter inhibens]AUQ75936.1 Beta-barrel assembly machine subunit BamF [Phaeobacter piscinae]AUQ96152.1 Beta-barrel assembly machine subunit BamF [Phaeobacter inhibens]
MRIPFGVIVLMGALAVSACGQKGLRDLRPAGTGPDEFMVLPAKPLAEPTSYQTLPQPTPGAANLTDRNPKGEAVAVLGGNPAALVPGEGIPASDGALVTAVSRYGVDPDVRADLAARDAKKRKRENRTARFKLFPVDRYQEAYKREAIAPDQVSERFRRAGFETPSAPPAE